MKFYLAYINTSDADVLFGVYSTNDKAVSTLMAEEGPSEDLVCSRTTKRSNIS